MSPVVIALTFAAIFVVEFPDKTFIATLVLSTRYRPLMVWLGVGAAFFAQTLIGVTAGSVASLLPTRAIHVAAAVIFFAGAVVLFRSAPSAADEGAEQEQEYQARATEKATGWRAVGASFLVLFAAEWGDLSQLLTISLVAKYHEPLAVFAGAWGALLAVSGTAVVAGTYLRHHIRLDVLHYLGALVCLALGSLTVYGLLA